MNSSQKAYSPPKFKEDFSNKSLVSISQLDMYSLALLFKKTKELKNTSVLPQFLKGKIVTLLFYEPSSRTRASFDAAVKRLGGDTILVENPLQNSSAAKGETLEDTIRTFATYSDAIVLRHPEKGAAERAAKVSTVPIINAGDGIGEHPTQALLDLYTFGEHVEGKDTEEINGLIVGDLKNGRTVHSFLKGLTISWGKQNTPPKIYLLSPYELRLERWFVHELEREGLTITELTDISEIPYYCDFWYWTRVQKERFSDITEYQKVKHAFVLDKKVLDTYGNPDMIIMHPLPRVGEITEEIDEDPRAVYFRSQIQNGMYVRMTLLSLILG